MEPKQDLTLERAAELFSYDAQTGVLTWRNDAGRWGRIKAGTKAGSTCTTGHLQVRVDGRLLIVHRICFTLANGVTPKQCVDHINGNPADNRAANLRDVSKRVNNQNIKRANSLSRHGRLGITPNGRNWKASIGDGAKQRYLGTFKTADEAQAAYLAAKRQLHEGCTL